MVKVVLDTNFLLIPGQFKVDIFEGIRKAIEGSVKFYVLESTLAELDIITKKVSGKDKMAIKLALSLIKAKQKSKDLNILPIADNIAVDDALAGLKGYIIATQDRELQRRLKTYLYLRQKKYVRLYEG